MTNITLKKDSRYYKFKNILGKVLVYLGLSVYALWILAPFIIVLITSLTPDIDIQSDFKLIGPDKWVLNGYKNALNYMVDLESGGEQSALLIGLGNTLLYVLPPTILGLFASAIAAFAFSKIRFKGSSLLFGLLLMTMLIPGSITTVPSYLVYAKLGLNITPVPLIVPGMFGAAACVFFLKQFFTGIPTELVEAAKLDGLGYFSIFWKIFVPLSVPALLAQGLLGFIGGYNDYFGPYLYLSMSDKEYQTLQVILRTFVSQQASKYGTAMSGCVLAMVPTIIIYLFCQKYFIEGIATSGMKL